MPTISYFYGIHIRMFAGDHNPPHFHARYSGEEAIVDIRTLEVLAGHLPRQALVLVLEWALDHRSELIEDWTLCANKQPPKPIAPLP